MKKQITIQGEGLAALQMIVGSASYSSRTDARKINTVAMCLQKPMKEYQSAMEGVQDKFSEIREDEETKEKKRIVPEDKVDEYKKAQEEARATEYTVIFDVESFSLCNTLVDKLFERDEIQKQNGLSGIDQARNIEQISFAFEKAIDVD